MSDAIEEKMKKVHWVPLESNPDMLNEFARKVGLPPPWEFCDVYGVDPDLLCMVPRPCLAVTLLFQCSDNLGKAKAEQRARLEASGQKLSPELVYLKQYVGNACGTIACTHSILNSAEVVGLKTDTPLGKFLASIKGKTSEEAGALLADAADLHMASEASAAGGQTAAPEASAATDHHFVCFIEKDGDVYELDGNKAFPVNHGSSGGDLLAAATRAIKTEFMDKDPENIQFNMMALVKQD
eukprot:gnl/TRDRNA2_/TRDRNA2_35158_c0_seq1.p1 gnl/TRDRNA2_/TRDRNA2_35158_c0~~gnl/TRDRNA2_/TRDRNA2_35158_c0_seq1.p1  ORF type:complete len:266 (+),score=53.98 gnl/TRDRNA2_/TRDRNA2_35158_c0_seq1:80-799(+)